MLRFVQQRGQAVLASNVPGGDADVQLSIASAGGATSAVACPLGHTDGALDLLYVVLPPECGTAEWLAVASLAAEQYQQSESDWARRAQLGAYVRIERDLEQARN